MNKNELLDNMEMLDSSIIEEADLYSKPKKLNLTRVIAIAASLLVVAGIGVVVYKLNDKNNEPVVGIGATEVGSGAPVPSGADMPNNDGNPDVEGTQVAMQEEGLFIPAIELPDTNDGAVMDMLGLVVYNGGIYIQTASYSGADAVLINNNLLGDYLGYATGSINEWSTQDEYTEEFASSIAGEVYEVIGYDSSFRICMKWEAELDNGETVLDIQFLDRLNGITLNTGSDLFEDRLHISNRVSLIQWQSHYDWNNANGNYQNANIDETVWNEFLNELNNGSFVYTWNPEITNDTIYDTDNQVHIYLTMNDGTVISLLLIESGYVGYEGLGWYFVQIPGEAFDAVFEACGGNH